MKKRLFMGMLSAVLCFSLCACGGDQVPAAPDAEQTPVQQEQQMVTEQTPPAQEQQVETTPPATERGEVDYPFLDEDGHYHYGIYLDGEKIPLWNDALLPTENNEYNEILYPLSEILDHFGVAYYWDKSNDDFSTVINGVKISHAYDDEDYFWISWADGGYSNSMIPGNINGVYYVSNYIFEMTIDAELTKIAKGEEMDFDRIDITTEGTYEWGNGSEGVAIRRWRGEEYIPDGEDSADSDGGVVYRGKWYIEEDSDSGSSGNSGGGSSGNSGSDVGQRVCGNCAGTGRVSCNACGGSGRAWNTQMVYDPISKMMKSQTVQTTCWACGGMRGSPCGNCGGDGKW